MEKVAYLYARFSTKKQEHGDSIKRQTQIASEWCDRNACKLSGETFEDLGVSAYCNKTKTALEAFIRAVEIGRIAKGSYLLIEDDDRLSRRGWKHTQDLMHRLVSLGVSVVITKTGRIYTQENINDLGDNIILMVNADRAHKESARKSDLIRSQRTRARENGLVTGKLPMWLKRSQNALGFDFNDNLKCVETLIEYRKQGKSLQLTARLLNEHGYTTSTGAAWSSSGVRSIISNRALYGAKAFYESDKDTQRIKKDPIDIQLDIFPALISFDTWESIQQKTGNRTGNNYSKRGAYSHLLKCGDCGSALIQRNSKYKEVVKEYRLCGGAEVGTCTAKVRIREPEKYVDRVLKDLVYQVVESSYVSKTCLLKDKLLTLEKTEDLMIDNGFVEQLADLYRKKGEIKQQIAESEQADIQHADQREVEYKSIFEIKDLRLRNIELRKLIKSINFYLKSQKGRSSIWHVVIEQINGFKVSFVLDQFFGKSEIRLIADGKKLATFQKEVGFPWED